MSLWNLGQEGGRYDKPNLALAAGKGLAGLSEGIMTGMKMKEGRRESDEDRKLKEQANQALSQYYKDIAAHQTGSLEEEKAGRIQKAGLAESEIRGRIIQSLIERGMLPKEAIAPEGGIDTEAILNRALGRSLPQRKVNLPGIGTKDAVAPKKDGFWKGIFSGAKEKWKEFDK